MLYVVKRDNEYLKIKMSKYRFVKDIEEAYIFDKEKTAKLYAEIEKGEVVKVDIVENKLN